MKTHLTYLTFLLLLTLFSAACSGNEKPKRAKPALVKHEEPTKVLSKDSMQFINECSAGDFVSTLEENTNQEDSSFTLTIKSKQGAIKKVRRLDVRPDMSDINYCTEDYVVVGFSCGGPCYSQVFVFTKEDRPNEQYGQCQRVYNSPNLLAHIENETFENLLIHNFDTGKELSIDISDCPWVVYGQMDTIYRTKNKLVVVYPGIDKQTKRKEVDLKPILN